MTASTLTGRFEVVVYSDKGEYFACDAETIDEARVAARTCIEDEIREGDPDAVAVVYRAGSPYELELFQRAEIGEGVVRFGTQGAR